MNTRIYVTAMEAVTSSEQSPRQFGFPWVSLFWHADAHFLLHPPLQATLCSQEGQKENTFMMLCRGYIRSWDLDWGSKGMKKDRHTYRKLGSNGGLGSDESASIHLATWNFHAFIMHSTEGRTG